MASLTIALSGLLLARPMPGSAQAPTQATPSTDRTPDGKSTRTQELDLVPLAPRGTSWWKAFQAWAGTVKKQSQGSVKLKLKSGAVGHEERTAKRLTTGKIDGATLSAVSLRNIVPELMVLQAPDIARDFATFQKVAKELGPALERACAKRGYVLIGLGNLGQARLLSSGPIQSPQSLRGVIAVHPKDQLVRAWSKGFKGLRTKAMPFSRVPEALRDGSINVAPASALAAFYMGWHKHTKFISETPGQLLLSATLIRKDAFDALSRTQQELLLSAGRKAHDWLAKKTLSEDREAFRRIVAGGTKTYSMRGHQSAWATKAKEARQRLVSDAKLFRKDLLLAAEKAAR